MLYIYIRTSATIKSFRVLLYARHENILYKVVIVRRRRKNNMISKPIHVKDILLYTIYSTWGCLRIKFYTGGVRGFYYMPLRLWLQNISSTSTDFIFNPSQQYVYQYVYNIISPCLHKTRSIDWRVYTVIMYVSII